jgi:signal transduction histidine kinase
LALATELEQRDYVVLAVQDNGIGTNEAIRAPMFEPFLTTRGDLGTGWA